MKVRASELWRHGEFIAVQIEQDPNDPAVYTFRLLNPRLRRWLSFRAKVENGKIASILYDEEAEMP